MGLKDNLSDTEANQIAEHGQVVDNSDNVDVLSPTDEKEKDLKANTYPQ